MKERRKARLAELIATRFSGDRGLFIAAVGLSKGRVSQLLDPDEAFGEKAAQRIVEKVGGLPRDYFERPETLDASGQDPPKSGYWPFSVPQSLYEELGDTQKATLDAIVSSFVEGCRDGEKKIRNGTRG